MTAEFVFRPIERWPDASSPETTPDDYRHSPWYFKSGFADTLSILRRELHYLDARNPVVIQLALDEAEIRLDGMPRSGSRPRHPGVILSFESKHGTLTYHTDEFRLWEHNLRAIALGLEALRKVDRYGISKGGQQYRGWKQLEAGRGNADPSRGRRIIEEHGSVAAALHATHPDHGGDPDDFQDVQAAREAGLAA